MMINLKQRKLFQLAHAFEEGELEGKLAMRYTCTLFLLSMSAVRGRKSNRFVKDFHTLAFPYLRKHSS